MSERSSRNTIIITDSSQISNVGSVYTFLANTTYIFSGTIAFGTSAGVTQLVMGDGTILKGNDPTVDKIVIQATTGSVITGADKNVSFYNLGINLVSTSTVNLFGLTGTGIYAFNLKGCIITGSAAAGTSTLGTINGSKNCRIEGNFFTKLNQGLTISGTIDELIFKNNISESNYNVVSFKLLNLLAAATFDNIQINDNVIQSQSNENFLTVGAITLTNKANVLNNILFGAGTYFTGVTPATPGWNFGNNAGSPVSSTGAVYQATPANPGGTSSAVGVMMGLAGSITPKKSGTVNITISGDYENLSGDTGCAAQMYTGTGVAPINGAAITGTARGGLVTMLITATTAVLSANRTPFSLNCVITGLTLGTPIWIDISLARTGGASTATARNISISAVEQ